MISTNKIPATKQDIHDISIFTNVKVHIHIIFIDERSNHVPKKKKEKEQMLAGDSVPAAASQVSFAPGAASNSSAASQAPLPSVCVPCIQRERERERERDVFA